MNAPLQKKCTHCGIRFTPPAGSDSAFCCNGCAFVHNLIKREGLDRFYELKQSAIGIPAGDRPFRSPNFDWIPSNRGGGLQPPSLPHAAAQGLSNPQSLTVSIGGVSCIGCVWLIERIFLREPGAIRASVDPARARATFTWNPDELDLAEFAQKLAQFGYTLRPADGPAFPADSDGSPGARLGICAALALNTMGFTLPRYLGMTQDFVLASLFELVAIASATLTFLIGGTWFISRAITALRHRVLHIDLPIAIGITAAYAASVAGWILRSEQLLYADFVTTFTFLMLAGRHLHLVATRKFQNQAADESTLTDFVSPLDPNKPPIPIAALAIGTEFQIPPGRALPVSAQLLAPDSASVSLAWMTGEPEPITYRPPSALPAGAQNLSTKTLQLRATEPWSSSLVSTLISPQSSSPLLVESATPAPSHPQFLKFYLLAVFLIALLGGTAWFLIVGPIPAVEVFIAVLIVSCPCAIGVALPLVDQRAANGLQRHGVFVKNPGIWSRLRTVRHVLFDKTGTVTQERPALLNPLVLDSLHASERTVLASMAAKSLHPLSRTLAEELAARGHSTIPDPDTEETPGLGLTLTFPQNTIYTLTKPKASHAKSGPACVFTRNGQPLAHFEFAEEPRPGTATTLKELTHLGLTPSILSGDSTPRVRALAKSLGLPETSARGSLTPAQKADAVRSLGAGSSLFLGDGGNDALAFDLAQATGAPASRDALLRDRADFVFTGRSLDFLPALYRTAIWRMATTRRVITFSVLYNAAAITLCLAGHMSPLIAAILMPLSSVATLLIASRRTTG